MFLVFLLLFSFVKTSRCAIVNQCTFCTLSSKSHAVALDEEYMCVSIYIFWENLKGAFNVFFRGGI